MKLQRNCQFTSRTWRSGVLALAVNQPSAASQCQHFSNVPSSAQECRLASRDGAALTRARRVNAICAEAHLHTNKANSLVFVNGGCDVLVLPRIRRTSRFGRKKCSTGFLRHQRPVEKTLVSHVLIACRLQSGHEGNPAENILQVGM